MKTKKVKTEAINLARTKEMMTSKIDKKALEFLKSISKKSKKGKQTPINAATTHGYSDAKKCNVGPIGQESTTAITLESVRHAKEEKTLSVQNVISQQSVAHETLSSVSAVLSPDLLNVMPFEKIQKLIDGCGVKSEQTGDNFVISGSWNMIKKVKKLLDEMRVTQKLKQEVQTENDKAVNSILDNDLNPLENLDDVADEDDDNECDANLIQTEAANITYTTPTLEVIATPNVYVERDKYCRNSIYINPRRGQVHRVVEKNPELAKDFCDICGYRSTKEGVNRHKQRRHATTIHKCEVCDAGFGVRYDMRRHRMNHFTPEGMLTKKGQRMWDAQHPDVDSESVQYQDFEENFTKAEVKSADDYDTVEKQIMEKTVNDIVKNTENTDTIATTENVHNTDIGASSSQKKKIRYPPKDTSRVDCPFCQKRFPSKVLPVHLKIHRKKEVMPCEYCAKNFTERGKLNAHIRSVHEKAFKCEICGQSLSGSTALKIHIEGKHGTKVNCEMCNKFFATATSYELHLRREHKKERPYSCSVCDKGFFDKRGLENHSVQHYDKDVKESMKKFECSYCKKKFLMKHTLKMHENTHTGKKPYKCLYPECGKAFPYTSMLNKHKKVHSSEKNFPCSECHKAFKFPYKLRQHMIIHTKDRTHSCQQCGKCFTTSTTLRLHNCSGNPFSQIMLDGKIIEINLSTEEGHQAMREFKERWQQVQKQSAELHKGAETIYVCGFCHKTFDDAILIHNHVKSYHSDEQELHFAETYSSFKEKQQKGIEKQQKNIENVAEDNDHHSSTVKYLDLIDSHEEVVCDANSTFEIKKECVDVEIDSAIANVCDNDRTDFSVEIDIKEEEEDIIIAKNADGTEFVVRLNPDIENVTRNVEISNDGYWVDK